MGAQFNLDALESAVLASPVTTRADLSPMIKGVLPDPHEALAGGPELVADDFAIDDDPAPALSLDLMTEGAFLEQWAMIHDMAGGMIQMRTGAPCPLGDQARGEGGRIAGQAAYSLMASNPTMARLFLSTQSTFWGQMAAIGMHGFACIQVVKASTSAPPPDYEEPEFASQRGQDDDQDS